MIPLLLLLAGIAPAAPSAVTIASVRGEQRVDVLTAPDGSTSIEPPGNPLPPSKPTRAANPT